MRHFKMLPLFIPLFLIRLSLALQAPYFISADPVSDYCMQLDWRNNDVATDSFEVLRRVAGMGVFLPIVTVPGDSLRYRDCGLMPLTTYEYCAIAIDNGERSDTSNFVQGTTLALKEVLKVKSLESVWYPKDRYVRISFIDSSIAEKRIDIYRLPRFKDPQLVASIINSDPDLPAR
jgi:hypothetical protein